MTTEEVVVLYAIGEGICEITLNRPGALNAWTPELGRAYFDRKVAEGKTKKEALRALKRQVSNAVYRQLVIDAQRARR